MHNTNNNNTDSNSNSNPHPHSRRTINFTVAQSNASGPDEMDNRSRKDKRSRLEIESDLDNLQNLQEERDSYTNIPTTPSFQTNSILLPSFSEFLSSTLHTGSTAAQLQQQQPPPQSLLSSPCPSPTFSTSFSSLNLAERPPLLLLGDYTRPLYSPLSPDSLKRPNIHRWSTPIRRPVPGVLSIDNILSSSSSSPSFSSSSPFPPSSSASSSSSSGSSPSISVHQPIANIRPTPLVPSSVWTEFTSAPSPSISTTPTTTTTTSSESLPSTPSPRGSPTLGTPTTKFNRAKTTHHGISLSCSRYILLDQPNPIQRKSYPYENRFVMPNPLKVVEVQSRNQPTVIGHSVTVSLVDMHGSSISTLDKSCHLIQPIYGGSAEFSLKITETSAGQQYRFKFVIKYSLEDDSELDYTETILSHPFSVITTTGERNKRVEK